jgi:hypothetical protein
LPVAPEDFPKTIDSAGQRLYTEHLGPWKELSRNQSELAVVGSHIDNRGVVVPEGNAAVLDRRGDAVPGRLSPRAAREEQGQLAQSAETALSRNCDLIGGVRVLVGWHAARE